MRRPRLITAVMCVLVCAGAATVDAQGRDQATVSRELFDGLCGFFGGPPPRVLSGELPKDFPSELIPEHSRVVGTLAGPSTVALFSVPDAVGAAAAVERQAEAAGWRVRPYELDGFMPSVPFDSNGPRCHGGERNGPGDWKGESVFAVVRL